MAQSVVAKVDECAAAIDDEKMIRFESEKQTVTRVGEQILHIQSKLDAERITRWVRV